MEGSSMKGKNISKKFQNIKETLKDNKSLIYKIVIFICILSGTFLIGFTLIIWKTYLHTNQTPQLTYNLFLTIGMGIFSIGIAFISIKIAEESKKQAIDTDDRINEIANTHFLTIVSSFEDKRLDIEKQIVENNKILNIIKYNEEIEKDPKNRSLQVSL